MMIPRKSESISTASEIQKIILTKDLNLDKGGEDISQSNL